MLESLADLLSGSSCSMPPIISISALENALVQFCGSVLYSDIKLTIYVNSKLAPGALLLIFTAQSRSGLEKSIFNVSEGIRITIFSKSWSN
ncbi:hypothetical protein D3C76_1380590 [compost metagenome]